MSLVETVNVSPLGKGCFRIRFKSPTEANEVLARSPVNMFMGIGFFSRWTQGMDLSGLDGGLIVTARFPGLLPEFVPHLKEIGRCIGFVVGDALIREGEDRTPRLRMILPLSLAKDPPLFISLPSTNKLLCFFPYNFNPYLFPCSYPRWCTRDHLPPSLS